MQKEINYVSAQLQSYQGHPRQLALLLKCEFNLRSQVVKTIDIEISKIVKEVKELQEELKAATGSVQTDQKVLKTGYSVPIKQCIVSDSGLPSVQPSILGFPITPNQFSILS